MINSRISKLKIYRFGRLEFGLITNLNQSVQKYTYSHEVSRKSQKAAHIGISFLLYQTKSLLAAHRP